MGLLESLNQLNPVAQGAGLVQLALGFGKGKPTTSRAVYEDLVHYFKYASSAYALIKVGNLNGAQLVAKMYDLLTDGHGYVAVDQGRKEIIVAFRGSVTPTNFVVDSMFAPVAFNNVNGLVASATVHSGFNLAWKAVESATLAAVKEQLDAHPGFAMVVLGHSLGGAMAALAGLQLKELYPAVSVRIFTYGAPRVGNAAFAKHATDVIGSQNVFRVVHAADGVPTMVPTALGFQHYGTEYWHLDPSGPGKTFVCNASGPYQEDPTGSARVPSTGINPDHLVYFVIPYITPFYI